MDDAEREEELFEVECPHCHRNFRAELIGGQSAQAGFKCPHCRLFVSYERAVGSRSDAG